MMTNAAKNVDLLAISLIILHNYFDVPIKFQICIKLKYVYLNKIIITKRLSHYFEHKSKFKHKSKSSDSITLPEQMMVPPTHDRIFIASHIVNFL